MTQPINRIVTLAFDGPFVDRPRRFVWGAYDGTTGALEDSGWQMLTNLSGLPRDLSPPRLASTMVTAEELSVALTEVTGLMPDGAAVTVGSTVIIYGPAGRVTFDVDGVAVSSLRNAIIMSVSGGTLTGTDFQVTAGVTVAFSGITSRQAGPETTMDVWARIVERGAESGTLAITTSEDVVIVRESAEVRVRFIDPAIYSRLVTLTDDLARVWTIRSFNATSDRRYLALDCVRNAT